MAQLMEIPGELGRYVISGDPLRLRIKRERWSLISVACLAAGIAMGAGFVMSVLGWFGVIAIDRGVYGVLGSAAFLLFGGFFSFLGIQGRWAREEIAFEASAIHVTLWIGPWRTVRELSPSRLGERMLIGIETGRTHEERLLLDSWLAVRSGRGAPILRIAVGFRLELSVLEAIGRLIVEWAERAGSEAVFDSAAVMAADQRERAR